MKESTFTFELRVPDEERESAMSHLCQALEEVAGVTSTSHRYVRYIVELKIAVQFTDSKNGVKLHRKILSLIKKQPGITIAGMETVLTDLL